jgi:hypothetical protein
MEIPFIIYQSFVCTDINGDLRTSPSLQKTDTVNKPALLFQFGKIILHYAVVVLEFL